MILLIGTPLISAENKLDGKNSSAYLQVIDTYTFEPNGDFIRRSITWLTHDDKVERKDLVFTKIFSDCENHQIIGNITYNLYWNWKLNQSYSFKPEDDFKKGDVVSDVISLKYGEKAHYERIYKSHLDPKLIDLALNLETIRENPKCENISCGDYKLSYFYRVVKIRKNQLLGLTELNVYGMTSQPDVIYDEGDYRTYLWKDFSLDMGDLKMIDIKFGYNYKIPSWLFWTGLFTILSILITYKITKYFSKKEDNDYYCSKCNKLHFLSKTDWSKHLTFKQKENEL